MINQEQLEIIKKATEEFFLKTCFNIEKVKVSFDEETILINIEAEDPQILIGEKGQTLSEVQYLLKIVLRKKISEPFYINLDINEYKQKKYEYLKEMACSAADEVFLNKKEKILDPMSAYERRIVHLELAERQDVITESIGYGSERKIVIKPKEKEE